MYAGNNNRAQTIKTLEMWKFFCCSSEKKYNLQLTCESVSKSDLIYIYYDFYMILSTKFQKLIN